VAPTLIDCGAIRLLDFVRDCFFAALQKTWNSGKLRAPSPSSSASDLLRYLNIEMGRYIDICIHKNTQRNARCFTCDPSMVEPRGVHGNCDLWNFLEGMWPQLRTREPSCQLECVLSLKMHYCTYNKQSTTFKQKHSLIHNLTVTGQ
jgi:hypothetical protein